MKKTAGRRSFYAFFACGREDGCFAAPAASPFWSDPKGAKRSPGDGSGEHQVVLLVARLPGPPITRELDSKAGHKCTGAGWPLTHRRSPARCHCVANPEGCLCYPFRRAFPGAPPWCGGRRFCTTFPMFSVGAAFGRPAGQATMIICVGRDDSARRVNRNANFKTTEYVIGNGCQYHLTQWYSFDAVRRVVPQGTFSCPSGNSPCRTLRYCPYSL